MQRRFWIALTLIVMVALAQGLIQPSQMGLNGTGLVGRTTTGFGMASLLNASQATTLLANCVGDSGSGGTKGLVPAPAAGDTAAGKFLKADCTWVVPSGSGGAPTTAGYVVQTADATLSNEFALGTLASGLILNTTTTGVPSIYTGTSCTNQFPRSLNSAGVATCAGINLTADVTGNLPVANGGTGGTNSPTGGGVAYGTGSALAYTSSGSSNQLLTSSGPGAPAWTTTLPTAAFPALTGDVTTSAGSLSTTLAASGVTASIYSNKALAVDAKGRITATSTSLASRSFYTQQEFVGAANTDNWTFLVSGTGAAWSNISPGTDNAIGVKRCATGTTATGRCSATSTQTDVLKFGNGTATFEALIRIPTLSTAAQTYTVRAGFIDQTAAETTDGAFLRYTDAVNAGKFQCVTRNNSVETATDTGLTVAAATWYKVLITVNAAGTNVNCTINGGNSTNVTTNIPTASGRDTGYGIFVLKSVGTTTVTALDVDYAEVTYDFTTPR